MADPTASGDPEAGRSDLYARIQDLQDDVEHGLTADQVDEAVRAAVAAMLPGLVSDAVSSAVAGAVPAVAGAVAAAVTERLPAPASDDTDGRLAGLEAAVDGIGDRIEMLTRDHVSTTVASLDDLRAQIAAVADDLGAEGQADAEGRAEIDALREDLADALDYVRTTLATDLANRTAETQASIREMAAALAALSPSEPQPLLDRLDEVGSRLDEIAAGLARTESAVERPEVDVGARVVEHLETRWHELVDTLPAAPDLGSLHERLDALPEQLPAPDLSSLHERLDALAASRPQVDLEPLLSRLDALEQALPRTDLGPVHQHLDDVVAQLSALSSSADATEALHVRFDSLLGAVDTASEVAGDRVAVETERLRAALSEQMGAAAIAQSAAVVDAVHAGVETAISAATASARDDAAAARQATEAVGAAAAAASNALTARVTSLEESVSASVDAADALRAELTAGTSAAERTLHGLAALRSQLGAIREDLRAPGEQVANELDALRGGISGAFDLLQSSVDDRLSALANGFSDQVVDVRTDVATTAGETLSAVAALRDGLGGRIGGLTDRLAGIDERLADLDPTESLRGQLEAIAARVDERAQSQLAALEQQRASQEAVLEQVRGSQEDARTRLEEIAAHPLLSGPLDLGDEVLQLRASVADAARVQERSAAAAREEAIRAAEAAAGRVQDLRDLMGALETQVGAAFDSLPQQVDSWRSEAAEDRARLSEALTGLEHARAEVAGLIERIREQGTAAVTAVEDASRTSAQQARADAKTALADLKREIDAARGALDGQAAVLRQDVADDVRAGVSAALDDVRAAVIAHAEETNAARSEMEHIAQRVQSAGRLVVAYLGERDAALEDVRDRVIVQLLEDVLSGLSRKDREKATEQARGLFARRRESRQAERWRQHREGVDTTLPAADDQELLALLDAPVPRPVRAPRPEGAPRPSPEPPTAPAPAAATTSAAGPGRQMPSATRAPAKKAGAAKAPAKGTAATTGPAKRPAPKKAAGTALPAKETAAKKVPTKKAAAKGRARTGSAGTAPGPRR